MVMPLGGMGVPRPPTEYILASLPKLKILLLAILAMSILRMISQAGVDGQIIEGLFDMFTPLFGYFLYRDVQTMSSCLCGFMMMAMLNFVFDAISLISRLASYGSLAFCTDGNKRPIDDQLIICRWYQPTFTCVLISQVLLQLWAGMYGYRMMKSSANVGLGDDALLGGGMPGGMGGGMGDGMGGAGGGQPQQQYPVAGGANARAPSFNAFQGQGQTLGQM